MYDIQKLGRLKVSIYRSKASRVIVSSTTRRAKKEEREETCVPGTSVVGPATFQTNAYGYHQLHKLNG